MHGCIYYSKDTYLHIGVDVDLNTTRRYPKFNVHDGVRECIRCIPDNLAHVMCPNSIVLSHFMLQIDSCDVLSGYWHLQISLSLINLH